MTRTITDILTFKQKALQWAAQFEVACYLDSNNFTDPYGKYNTLIAVGVTDELTAKAGDAFKQLEHFRQKYNNWVFGFLGYDLKNEIEQLSSQNIDGLQFPDLYFFVPKHIISITNDFVEITGGDPESLVQQIQSFNLSASNNQPTINLKSRFSKQEYVDTANKIKGHISRGDIYVTNFCQEFYAENTEINPLQVFQSLNGISPNPFSCFFKLRDQYILCASPERFLAKRGNKLISQPIKGTAKRSADKVQDEINKKSLQLHTKELQENVMIVDLVRNDLTRSAKSGTVKTEELFGVYSFKQVHQMISTVSCEIAENISEVQAIKNTFPMGSMTGAPKVSAMQLMEQYERTKRGVYSGTIGYFSPDGDFDFNVVIRTLLYNAENKYLSFQTGSAITFNADAEKEYEECLLKAKAILEVLGAPSIG
ncbi:anthranilate synthase component I family protein [Mucilaginibacter limnophilus]|uniref:Anthranilate synthase component I family protein n=1 Tax=Mucilaginibacter limnophilus TaxID=1932778 RepID=A0A437MQK6_9SPHI|nr:anthranilate synthase component I family protein [Mucilaginibacter limnophilus]RVT99936.1 anthranilate synthase component I family protein [Mucilaginibacter limnophilus]